MHETVIGIVANAYKLHIYKDPSIESDIIFSVYPHSELVVDLSKSTAEWLCVCTAIGIEGYCLREYVRI